VGADIDVVDVEQRQFLVAGLVDRFERFLGDLLARLRVDFAGLRVDEVFPDIVTHQLLVGHAQRLRPFSPSWRACRTVSFLPASNTTLPVSASTRSLIAL